MDEVRAGERLLIDDGLVRLSVGIEDVADLEDDLETALAASRALNSRHAPPSTLARVA